MNPRSPRIVMLVVLPLTVCLGCSSGPPGPPPGDGPYQPPGDPPPAGPVGIYAEALQKSLHFYDAQKSGPGVGGGRLLWRGDSQVADARVPLVPRGDDGKGTNLSLAFIDRHRGVLDPDGDGALDLGGGFHDAGDHVKFGLPQSYAASTLGWGFYEFRQAFVQSGQERHMLEILRWFCDYFIKSTFRDPSGKVVAFAYQVGEGSVDHNYWGPPELQDPDRYPRPAYLAAAGTPASDQAAGAAAALALMYLNSRDSDGEYAERCLDTARALYDFAVEHRGLGYSGGFYNSSYDDDELAWAAVWLHIATGAESYLDHIVAVSSDGQYRGYLKRIMSSLQDGWQNVWVHCWDTLWGGVFVKLAPITGDPKHQEIVRWNLEHWSGIPHRDPGDNGFVPESPGGFRVINTWGSARYNAAAQLCALVYRQDSGEEVFSDWARDQMEYIMGDNPLGRSYIVGLTDDYARHPHHRAAHGSNSNSTADPPEHRHVLWGALVGGPDLQDRHVDETGDFVYNEVAIDYNAGLVGALAGLYTFFGQGQGPLVGFPPPEQPVEAYYTEARLEQENTERTQITVSVHNQSQHPPHFEESMSVRYYFDISELLAAGQTVSDVSLQIMYDENQSRYGGPAEYRGPLEADRQEGIYYVEFDWSGYPIHGKRDLHFALVAAQDAAWTSHWDPGNDFSRQGITSDMAATRFIPVYLDGRKVFGEEPRP